MRVSEAVAPYLSFCRVEKLNSPQTVQKVDDCFRVWITPLIGEIDLGNLSILDVLKIKSALVEQNRSPSRQYSVIMALKSFLKFCIMILKVKTLDPSEVKLPDRGKPHVLSLSREEIDQLLTNVPHQIFTGARLRALIEVLLATGMRISEALSLNRDVFEAHADHTEIVGKGKKHREVFFTERCYYWVQNYLNKRADDNPALFVTTGVFPRRMAREDVSRFFVNLRQKAGMKKKITPHVLRHTYCTNLLNNGADIMFIKELVGHEDIQTTAKYYLSVSKEQLRKVVDKYLDYHQTDAETK